jgi:hypothetical protein
MDADKDEDATNWHLYDEADALLKAAEVLVPKLYRSDVRDIGEQCLKYLWILRRLCDQHAG